MWMGKFSTEIYTIDELRWKILNHDDDDFSRVMHCDNCLFRYIHENPNEDDQILKDMNCRRTLIYCLEKYCGGVLVK